MSRRNIFRAAEKLDNYNYPRIKALKELLEMIAETGSELEIELVDALLL